MSDNEPKTEEQRLVELYELLWKSRESGLMVEEAKIVVARAYEFEVKLEWERLGLDGSLSRASKYTKLAPPPKAPRWGGETSYDRDIRLARERLKRETEKAQAAKVVKKERIASLKATQGKLF